jgi:hypothetical protein
MIMMWCSAVQQVICDRLYNSQPRNIHVLIGLFRKQHTG